MIRWTESFTEDSPQLTECEVTGAIPDWVDGSLYRTGPGHFQYGSDVYKHLFDGRALVHRFKVKDGKVSYHNKITESQSHIRNLAANGIVSGGFNSVGFPDPCKSIFKRYFSYFLNSDQPKDNTLVNIMNVGDQLYCMTETSQLNRVHPDTLDCMNMVDVAKIVSVHFETAHPVQDSNGTTYNIGTKIGRQAEYKILKLPYQPPGVVSPLDNLEILGSIPSQFGANPGYTHSFCVSENYVIYVEQPLVVQTMKLVLSKVNRNSFCDCLKYEPHEKAIFHVMEKNTGKLLPTKYKADAFFMFHQINSYEDGGHLVVDLSTYQDAAIIQGLMMDALKEDKPLPNTVLSRFVLPLNVDKGATEENLVTLSDVSATATLSPDGSVFCRPEVLSEANVELPRINEKFSGKKYRYAYGVALEHPLHGELQKVDLVKKHVARWRQEGYAPGEPVFVADPGATEEDQGVILAPVHTSQDEQQAFLVVLDAASFTEIARAIVPGCLPFTFHGIFTNIPQNSDTPQNI